MRNGAAEVSAGAAPCKMVSFVKPFRTSVARQVSRKVEPLSISATVATIPLVDKIKQECQCTTPLSVVSLSLVSLRQSETGTANFKVSFNVPEQVSTFNVTRCNAC